MGDLRINIRVLMWHLQISRNWKPSVSYNDYHKNLEHGWFEVYEFELTNPKEN